MRRLKTATGTDYDLPRIGILMEPSAMERFSIETILKNEGFEVYYFENEKEYHLFRRETPLDITFLLGRTSLEVGAIIGLVPDYKESDFCMIGDEEVAKMLGLGSLVYVLSQDFSREDLINKVHEIMNKQ